MINGITWTHIHYTISLKSFRGSLFCKPVTGQEPFFCCFLQQTGSRAYCPNIYTDAFVIQQCHAPLTARQSTRLVSKLAPSIAFLLPMKNNLQTFLIAESFYNVKYGSSINTSKVSQKISVMKT